MFRQRYQVLDPTAPVPVPDDRLEQLVRRGVQRLLQAALAEAIADDLGRGRAERRRAFRGRVSDVPAGQAPFQSAVVSRWQRRSRTQEWRLVRLYLEGLASGDFEPVFCALVGETAALSPTSIARLQAEWQAEDDAWRQRPLPEHIVYRWADGFYLNAGPERDTLAVLVVLGGHGDGRKELLAMAEGYREDTPSWADVLRDLKTRGLTEPPLVAVGDGALGLWAALDQVYPTTRHARCWNHRALNLWAKLPQRLPARARAALRAMYEAPTRAACTERRDASAAELRGQGYPEVAAWRARDWDDFTAFSDFPEEPWRHLRTSNPIESVFSGVRLRTDAAKRHKVRAHALYLTFTLVLRLSANWRLLDGPNPLQLLLLEHRFIDGKLQLAPPPSAQEASAYHHPTASLPLRKFHWSLTRPPVEQAVGGEGTATGQIMPATPTKVIDGGPSLPPRQPSRGS